MHTTRPEFLDENFTRPPDGGTDTFGADIAIARDPYRAEVEFKEVQDAYDPAVGFTPRRGFRHWSPEFNWSPRLDDHPFIRGFQIGADAEINLGLDNHLIDRNLQFTPMELEFDSGDGIELQFFKQTEHLEEDFEISDGVPAPGARLTGSVGSCIRRRSAGRSPAKSSFQWAISGTATGAN